MSPPQLLHVAIVCAGYNSSREVITLVKSMLFYRYSQVSMEEGQKWGRGQNLDRSLVLGLQLPPLWHGDGIPSSLEEWLQGLPEQDVEKPFAPGGPSTSEPLEVGVTPLCFWWGFSRLLSVDLKGEIRCTSTW